MMVVIYGTHIMELEVELKELWEDIKERQKWLQHSKVYKECLLRMFNLPFHMVQERIHQAPKGALSDLPCLERSLRLDSDKITTTSYNV